LYHVKYIQNLYFRKPIDGHALIDAVLWAMGAGKEKMPLFSSIIFFYFLLDKKENLD